jgi:hypothetical protein
VRIHLSVSVDEVVDNTFNRCEVKQLQGENEFVREKIMICITMVKINNVSYTNHTREGRWRM